MTRLSPYNKFYFLRYVNVRYARSFLQTSDIIMSVKNQLTFLRNLQTLPINNSRITRIQDYKCKILRVLFIQEHKNIGRFSNLHQCTFDRGFTKNSGLASVEIYFTYKQRKHCSVKRCSYLHRINFADNNRSEILLNKELMIIIERKNKFFFCVVLKPSITTNNVMILVGKPSITTNNVMTQVGKPSIATKNVMIQVGKPSIITNNVMIQVGKPSITTNNVMIQVGKACGMLQ